MEIRNALERMLQAERAADEIVAEAERNARTVIESARATAAEITASKRKEAQRKYQHIIKDAAAKAQDEKKHRLDEFRQKIEALVHEIPDENRRKATEIILRAVAMLD